MQRAQQLGRYHLLDRIAFGGMAEIYRAKTFDSTGQAHLVAVKRVLSHLVEDEDFIQMLVDEAKIAGLLQHPNIARVYEFSRAHGEYFIAMEHVDGKDCRSLLERCRAQGRPVPPQHAAWIASEVARGLHAAHTLTDHHGRLLKIVHRDVSPSNVICAYSGEVKLCDFGIAKATLSRVQTKTGVIKGKVKYMSPEQALGRKLDHRSDIFSLGAVLYELLTRFPPFTAANEMELLVKVRDTKFRPVHEVEPQVPDELVAIVNKSLSRSRSGRYQSAEELDIALKVFLADHYPGYTRSHLGAYIRRTFAAEIEKELRQLEDYVLDEPDPVNVGENLIADALGPDAPYSQFTPIAAPAGGTAPSVSTTRPPTSIHEEETKILDRPGGPAAPSRGAAPGGGAPRGGAPRGAGSIHDEPTKILDPSRRS